MVHSAELHFGVLGVLGVLVTGYLYLVYSAEVHFGVLLPVHCWRIIESSAVSLWNGVQLCSANKSLATFSQQSAVAKRQFNSIPNVAWIDLRSINTLNQWLHLQPIFTQLF